MNYYIEDASVYTMSQSHAPVLNIQDGDTVTFVTKDCFNNQVQDEQAGIDTLDWDRINPACGPVFVEGAVPGDALKITIKEIQVAETGTMAAIPENGVLGRWVEKSSVKRIPIKDGYVCFRDDIKIPLDPMIGVIGVAPPEGAVACGEPGAHGGNMDNTKIRKGAALYLPVFHPGALLALGDVHACMGDGEIMVSGVEIPAKVTVTVEVQKQMGLENPRLEDPDFCYAIASHENLELAIRQAVYDMNQWIQQALGMDLNEAGMLQSAVGNLEICQVVDPKRTVRFSMPRTILKQIDR